MKKKIMTMLMLLAVSCMIMPTNAKAAKKHISKQQQEARQRFCWKNFKIKCKNSWEKEKDHI